MGINALGSFFGGMAQGAFQGAVIGADADRQAQLEQARSDIELKRQKALALFANDLKNQDEAAKIERAKTMGKAITARASDLAIPGDAAAMSAANDSTVDPNNPETAATLKTLRSPEGAAARSIYERTVNPDTGKPYLQGDTETGRLRREAQAADELGATGQAEERRKQLDTERRFAADKSKSDADSKRLDSEAQWRKDSEERKMKHDEAMLKLYEARYNKEDERVQAAAERELRASTTAGLKNIEKELAAFRKTASDPMATDQDKTEAKQAIAALTREQTGYRRALLGAGYDKEGGQAGVDPLSFLPKPDAPAKPAASPAPQPTATAPQAQDKQDLAKQLAYIDEKLRDPAMGGKDRLQLERMDILRQMNAGGVLNQTKSLSFMRR